LQTWRLPLRMMFGTQNQVGYVERIALYLNAPITEEANAI
jgi:hypothetical protein